MSAFDAVLNKARQDVRRIVLPEASDERVIRAASAANKNSLANIILIGNPDNINALASQAGVSLNGISIVDHLHDPARSQYIERLVEVRQHRGMTVDKAKTEIDNTLVYASMMLANNDADGIVAGAITATASVVKAALQLVGKHADVSEVSSFFIMLLKERHPVKDVMVIGDCALVIDPDSDTLASIAASTGVSAQQLLGIEPEVAMLSFSTAGSARHKHVSKVRSATESLRRLKPDWRVVGEVQLDAAVIPSILAKKAPEQATESPCNVLIFPNLDAGNIGYKLIERFGGAQAIGPILQGLNKPVNDLSRGCSTEDIVSLIAVTAAQCGAK